MRVSDRQSILIYNTGVTSEALTMAHTNSTAATISTFCAASTISLTSASICSTVLCAVRVYERV
jgi:hypothetical protein